MRNRKFANLLWHEIHSMRWRKEVDPDLFRKRVELYNKIKPLLWVKIDPETGHVVESSLDKWLAKNEWVWKTALVVFILVLIYLAGGAGGGRYYH